MSPSSVGFQHAGGSPLATDKGGTLEQWRGLTEEGWPQSHWAQYIGVDSTYYAVYSMIETNTILDLLWKCVNRNRTSLNKRNPAFAIRCREQARA